MKVLILEDVIEHQVRLERILDEISKESNIPISYKTTGKSFVSSRNILKMMK